jgi:hypothetical protein
MAQRRDLCEEARVDLLRLREAGDGPLGIDKQLDGLDAGRERRLDQILALTTEQAQALALIA